MNLLDRFIYWSFHQPVWVRRLIFPAWLPVFLLWWFTSAKKFDLKGDM